jgi:hypothetical protein
MTWKISTCDKFATTRDVNPSRRCQLDKKIVHTLEKSVLYSKSGREVHRCNPLAVGHGLRTLEILHMHHCCDRLTL